MKKRNYAQEGKQKLKFRATKKTCKGVSKSFTNILKQIELENTLLNIYNNTVVVYSKTNSLFNIITDYSF